MFNQFIVKNHPLQYFQFKKMYTINFANIEVAPTNVNYLKG